MAAKALVEALSEDEDSLEVGDVIRNGSSYAIVGHVRFNNVKVSTLDRAFSISSVYRDILHRDITLIKLGKIDDIMTTFEQCNLSDFSNGLIEIYQPYGKATRSRDERAAFAEQIYKDSTAKMRWPVNEFIAALMIKEDSLSKSFKADEVKRIIGLRKAIIGESKFQVNV